MTTLYEKFKAGIARLRVDDLSDFSTHAQNLYDTLDDWDAASLLGRAYTLFHPLEPRYLIWAFLITIPIIVGIVVAFIDQSLTALFRLKHQYIAHEMSSWAGENGGKLFLCALAWGSLSSLLLGLSYAWSRKMAAGTAGRGLPRVLANLNGVYMPHWGHFRILFAKICSVILTVLSGVPYDFVGNISEIGAMIGACSISRNPWYQKLVPFSRYFRNSRDARLIVAFGIASAATAAFRSPIGGVALLIELSAVKFNVKFLYRVFLACNICGFVVQIIYTHLYGFELRETAGEWDMVPLSQLIQVQENLLTVLPAVFLGLVGGLFQGVFAVCSNFILNRPGLKSIQTLLIVGFIHSTVIYLLAGIFGLTNECRVLVEPTSKYASAGTPVYSHSSMFCDQKFHPSRNNSSNGTSSSDAANWTTTTSTTTTSAPFFNASGNGTTTAMTPEIQYVNAFASLTLGFDSSILRLLFRRRVPQFWTAPELGATVAIFCVMLPFLTVLSIVDGDVLMPTGLLGGCVGQLVYLAVRSWGFDREWIDGGLFALLGAVSFIGGMTRLTFSLTFLFVDYAGDVRHVLFIMMAISVARAVADRVAPVRIDYIVMKYQGYALLDFALRIEKYDSITLHEFQQKDLKVIPPAVTVGQLVRLLKTSFHNAFPVIEPQTQRFIGLVHRRTLQLVVWGFSDRLPPELQHPEDWPGRLPEGSLHNMVSTHNFMAVGAGATQSSAVHSIRLAAPHLHNPRGQYESFFTMEEQKELAKSTTATTATPVGSPVPSSALNESPQQQQQNQNQQQQQGRSPRTTAQQQQQQQPPPIVEDFDHFDVAAAGLEYHRLRDLDDYLFSKYSEDDALLFQFAKGIKPERSLTHRAFVEETDLFDDETKATVVNLVRYTDRSSFTVRAAMCVSRLYNMFTVLGLRHATIVDYQNRPTGVITRRDLMTYRIIEKKNRQGKFNIYGDNSGVVSGRTIGGGGGAMGGGDGIPIGNAEEDEERDRAIVMPGSGVAPSKSATRRSTQGPSSATTVNPAIAAWTTGTAAAGTSAATAAGAATSSSPTSPVMSSILAGAATQVPAADSQGRNPNSLHRFYDDDEDKARLIQPGENEDDEMEPDAPASPMSEDKNRRRSNIHNNKALGAAAADSGEPNLSGRDKWEMEERERKEKERAAAEAALLAQHNNADQSAMQAGIPRAFMYQVNRMRPPMLLPRGWNGSGSSSAAANSNNNKNKNVNTGGGSSNNSGKKENTSSSSGGGGDDDNDGASRASYSTVVSEPEV